jgi:EF-P beta-lysylation protein EpmB
MITPTRVSAQPDSWQTELARAVSDPAELLDALQLPGRLLGPAQAAAREFPLRVTRHYLGLIEPGNHKDPLLRQVLPLGEELIDTPGFVVDPVGDKGADCGPGLLQKYHGRALVVATGACAIHCRYCFRRHFPYTEQSAARHWEQIPERIRGLAGVKEVILSGGDPLTLSDQRLEHLIRQLDRIPHLQRLRIHTRLPSVLPSRVTPHLADLLGSSRLGSSLVLHCNHPRELSPALETALEKLRRAGAILMNQSVLLRGVNDTVDTLQDLSEALYAFGVLPYYLHVLDPVAGSAHFDVPEPRARQLHRRLRNLLPGYLVPKLVREIVGGKSKTPL